MADQQAPAEQTEVPQTTDAPQAGEAQDAQPDALGQINDRLKEWGEQLPTMVAQQVADQLGGYDYDPYQQQGYQDQYQQPEQDPYGGLDPNDPVQAELIRSRQELAELKQGFQGIQTQGWTRDLQGVLGRYPELDPQSERHDPQAAQHVMNAVQQLGFDVNGTPPIPAIELAYKAYRADQIAQQQQPVADGQGVTLETGQAQQQQPEPDPIQEIFGEPKGPPNPAFGWAVK